VVPISATGDLVGGNQLQEKENKRRAGGKNQEDQQGKQGIPSQIDEIGVPKERGKSKERKVDWPVLRRARKNTTRTIKKKDRHLKKAT